MNEYIFWIQEDNLPDNLQSMNHKSSKQLPMPIHSQRFYYPLLLISKKIIVHIDSSKNHDFYVLLINPIVRRDGGDFNSFLWSRNLHGSLWLSPVIY